MKFFFEYYPVQSLFALHHCPLLTFFFVIYCIFCFIVDCSSTQILSPVFGITFLIDLIVPGLLGFAWKTKLPLNSFRNILCNLRTNFFFQFCDRSCWLTFTFNIEVVRIHNVLSTFCVTHHINFLI